MKIRKLALANFRNFEEAEFVFQENFTVIIGGNGLGKSTVLHALKVAAGVFFSGISGKAISGISKPTIDYGRDVRYTKISDSFKSVPNLPCKVNITEWFIGTKPQLPFAREIPEGSKSNKSDEATIGSMRRYGQSVYNTAYSTTQHEALPILAYFDTGRLHKGSRKREQDGEPDQFHKAYKNWDDLNSNVLQYPQWLRELDPSNKKHAMFEDIFRRSLLDVCPEVHDVIIRADQLWFSFQLAASNEDQSKLSATIPNEDGTRTIEFRFLSDGYKVIVGMVAELVFRAIILNEHLEDKVLMLTPGLVMVDELDMHLHPNWQREIVGKLTKVFPSVQFVATTHSPFIVHSLKEDQLINLGGEDFAPKINPSDSPLSEVIKEELKVENAEQSPVFLESRDMLYDYLLALHNIKKPISEEANKEWLERLEEIEQSLATDPYSSAILKLEKHKAGLL